MSLSPAVRAAGILLLVLATASAAPTPLRAQDPPDASPGCVPEAEPNDRPEAAPSLAGDLCQSGTLVEATDQDLIFWEVPPEDGLTRWAFTMRGVPTTITSVHLFIIRSAPGVTPIDVFQAGRVDSDAHPDMPPGVAELQLKPGRYLLGISRGTPGYRQTITDDRDYQLSIVADRTLPTSGDVEPNDDPTSATTVSGAFDLAGDLVGSEDHYRWTLSEADAAVLWRLSARTSRAAVISIDLSTADGAPVGYVAAQADGDGVAMLHDLGLPAGEYRIRLRPTAVEALPYALEAAPLTDEGVDAEPNDAPEHALAIDPATLVAQGRLTTGLDVDHWSLDIGHAFAGRLVDIELSWEPGPVRGLCLTTEVGTRIGCVDGSGHIDVPGMLLPQGRYLLQVHGAGDQDHPYQLSIAPGEALPPTAAAPPGPDAATASPVSGVFAVSGDLTGSGHVYAWTVSEADATHAWRLEVSATPAIGGYLALYDATGASHLASAAFGQEGTARLWDLRLPAGTYTVWLTQAGSASPVYVLRSAEETAAEIDPEPDDLAARALPLDPTTLTARGRIPTNDDIDRYSFVLDEAMAANLVEASLTWPGQGLYGLCLEYEHGQPLQCREARDGIVLSNLALPPGRYGLQVTGNADPDNRYDVHVGAGAAPSPDREREPNDVADTATAWDETLVMHGQSLDGDVDMYRVHVDPGIPGVWRLEVSGSGLGSPLWTQPDGTRVGVASVVDDGTAAAIEDLYLVQGDHLLSVSGDGEYTLALTPLGPPAVAIEHEPNDDPDHSGALRVGEPRTGRLPVVDDVDVWRFSLAAPEHLVITAEPPPDGSVALDITSAGSRLASIPAAGAGAATVFDGHLPHSDYEVWLRPGPPTPGGVSPPAGSDGAYTIRMERADPFLPGSEGPESEALAADLVLTTTTTEVAAFALDGQRVEGVLTVTNTGATDLALTLDAAVSHSAWAVRLSSPQVSVPASASLDVPLTVLVPADAWLDTPVRVTVRARDASHAQGTAFVDITPGRDAPPVAPEQVWTVPPELLGGLDVASAALGGQPTTQHFHEADIHDGLNIAGLGLTGSVQNGPDTIGVDLAGDESVPVVGTILDPMAGEAPFAYRPRAFALLLSEDGVSYQEVLRAELGPQTFEQAFVLPEPVPARFAQLRIDSTWGEPPTSVFLGEWKVVAAPESAPIPAVDLDIANVARGGHVVWTDPPSQAAWHQLLTETDTGLSTEWREPSASQTWVVGFVGDRAAQVAGLEWVDQVGSLPEQRYQSVDVSVSAEPFGPWQDLGTWTLERAQDGSVTQFTLAEPQWARFARLTLPGPTDAAAYRELPSVIRILERPTDDTYRSILAEWGQSSQRAIYELLVPPPAFTASAAAPDVGDTAAQAAPVDAGETADGQVTRSKDVDWFALTVPDGQNTLTIDLRTVRDRDVRLRLVDAAGSDVELLETGGTQGDRRLTAIVEPGAYHLEVVQPVLSVVVTFDTSASIFPWFPKLRSAVRSFADDVTPGQEAIQIFPFGEPELLESWSDQPFLIGGAMDGWVTAGGSSALEPSIKRAADILIERDGMRAILALGDAVGGGFEVGGIPATQLDLVRPAIFPVHLGGIDDPAVSTRIMQDLAAAGDGFYQYATSQAAIERAFDRMATWLRRPAPYSLMYGTSAVEYPPGSITVVAAEGTTVPVGADVGVELVLDTSGSMKDLIGSTTKIAVAKEVLTRLVNTAIPEGVPVALRVFEPKKKTCGTRLAVPLEPLDRAKMTEVIKKLPIKTDKTPLAVTLAAVPGDLRDRPGPKVVVVVSDGKETCGGDPGAEVQKLVDAGIEASLSIVGLGLEDPQVKADMQSWAVLGGGRFYDAQDADALEAGVIAALQAPFRIYDETGVPVGRGVVGGAGFELPIGTYRVEVLSEPPYTFEAVELGPGAGVELTVGGDR